MKKGLLFLLLLFILIIAGIYLFIPNQLKVSRELLLDANSSGIYRCLSEESNWARLWPKNVSDSLPEFNGYQFELRKKLFKTIEVVLKTKDSEYSSGMLFIPLEHDSALIRWEAQIETSSNPIKKLNKYFEARKIANTLSSLLSAMKPWLETEENLYMLSIKQGMVVDTAFVSTRTVFNHLPTTTEVYAMIGKLHDHIAKQNGRETGPPMLNIDSSGNNPAGGSGKAYEVMVAIATDRLLPESGDIKLKRMIRGNILVAEVKGGPLTIKEGMRQMNEYVRDYQRTPAAIPFQLLVTDRSKEIDTTKWVTELRYPVF